VLANDLELLSDTDHEELVDKLTDNAFEKHIPQSCARREVVCSHSEDRSLTVAARIRATPSHARSEVKRMLAGVIGKVKAES
jgi:hypothetical protein